MHSDIQLPQYHYLLLMHLHPVTSKPLASASTLYQSDKAGFKIYLVAFSKRSSH